MFLIPAKPQGLTYSDEILSPLEESNVIRQLEGLGFYAVRMHGVESKRSVIHFGWQYNYTNWKIAPTEPLPMFLEFLRKRAADFAGVPARDLEQVLIARYPRGAGIGWHRDAAAFGEPVVGISLGSPCVMRFRRDVGAAREVYPQLLNQRSVYSMRGESRWNWQHGIPATKSLRYSITFRTLAEFEKAPYSFEKTLTKSRPAARTDKPV